MKRVTFLTAEDLKDLESRAVEGGNKRGWLNVKVSSTPLTTQLCGFGSLGDRADLALDVWEAEIESPGLDLPRLYNDGNGGVLCNMTGFCENPKQTKEVFDCLYEIAIRRCNPWG